MTNIWKHTVHNTTEFNVLEIMKAKHELEMAHLKQENDRYKKRLYHPPSDVTKIIGISDGTSKLEEIRQKMEQSDDRLKESQSPPTPVSSVSTDEVDKGNVFFLSHSL